MNSSSNSAQYSALLATGQVSCDIMPQSRARPCCASHAREHAQACRARALLRKQVALSRSKAAWSRRLGQCRGRIKDVVAVRTALPLNAPHSHAILVVCC